MENEKKTAREQNGADHDNRQPRRKGYFITPVSEEGKRDAALKPTVEKSSATPGETSGEGKQSHKGNGHSRRRRGHGNRPPKPAEESANASGAVKESSAEERKEPAKANHKKSSHNRPTAASPEADGNQQEKTQSAPVKAGEGRSRSRRSRNKKKHNKDTVKESPQTIESAPSSPVTSGGTRPQNRSDLRLKMSLDPEPDPMSLQEPEEEPIDAAALSPDVLESPPSMAIPDESVPRIEVVGIRFKSSGKVYYFNPAGKKYARGSSAIVETARGLEYGVVAMANTHVKESDVVPPLRPVIRAATEADIARHDENTKKEKDAFRVCTQKIQEHKLDMKLIDAQYTFDNSKLLFYFTSAGRVDFRELVKDLAGVFRTRIELRQIGIRDEAKMMGGLGMCGRPLCCSVFLSDFCQVSIKMAKEQNFSLNSSKISGICGRLMCCLRYEHETYEYEIKRTPPVNSVVETPDGNGVVIENSPLAGTVKVRLSVTPEVAPKVYRREDVTVLQKKQTPQPNQNNNQNASNHSQTRNHKK